MKNLAVFASGSGTNFQAIIDSVEEGQLPCKIALLVTDNPQAEAIKRAKNYDIPTFVFSAKNYPDKAAYEKEILKQLAQANIEWIVLAGYMRLIGGTLLTAYKHRIVNIHPSLLPSFAGKDAIGQALKAKVKITGVTIHFVDEGMDTGPVIAQQAIEINNQDDYDSLQKKIHSVEHKLYPQTLKNLFI
jgi:phosphoribosylglycinamide formyltransferase-1